jgi:hypothetical protein
MEGTGVVAIGMGLAFLAYATGIWGYCLVRGYDVSFPDVFADQWPGVQVTPSPGHQLGTINGNVSTTNPGQ